MSSTRVKREKNKTPTGTDAPEISLATLRFFFLFCVYTFAKNKNYHQIV